MRKLELLAPAKDADVAFTAIRNGADALYIGGPAFGARKVASNTLEDIKQVVDYAHRFYCRVFLTLNTTLYDDELQEAERLIKEYYRIGVDALIIQDPAILRLDIPPIALHASTQMHNYDLERIKFLDDVGFKRIVLARELSLEQIRAIRKEVKAELEYFVHGALCVSLSGQCYISHHLTGRSANRGECAQMCRMKWTLSDGNDKLLLKDKYLLSLKDLNLSANIPELIEAGIDSFKIEGRLKDKFYVANVTNYYSEIIDRYIANREGVCRVGSGKIYSNFTPDPGRSFNRGKTTYFLNGRFKGIVNMDTPKSMGKFIGTVIRSGKNILELDLVEPLYNGDGLCYIEDGDLKGIKVNRTEGSKVFCRGELRIAPETKIYRNYDHNFTTLLERDETIRKIDISITLFTDGGKLTLLAEDEDRVTVSVESKERFELATNPLKQMELISGQLAKTGGSIFNCKEVIFKSEDIPFIPIATINEYRRELLDHLITVREEQRERLNGAFVERALPYIGETDWRLNINNRLSELFYIEHGVDHPEWGFETSRENSNRIVMRTRYCVLYELGMCLKDNKRCNFQQPLYISNDLGKFRLEFDCKNCFMNIISL